MTYIEFMGLWSNDLHEMGERIWKINLWTVTKICLSSKWIDPSVSISVESCFNIAKVPSDLMCSNVYIICFTESKTPSIIIFTIILYRQGKKCYQMRCNTLLI